MFLSRGDRDLGVAFQTHPGRQAFRKEAGFGASPLGHGATMEIINNLLELKLLELRGRDLGDNKVGGWDGPDFYKPGAA